MQLLLVVVLDLVKRFRYTPDGRRQRQERTQLRIVFPPREGMQ